MSRLERFAKTVDVYEDLPRAIQLVLGDPTTVIKRASDSDARAWRQRRTLFAGGFAAIAASGPPLLTLVSTPAILGMIVRQSAGATWGIGAQVARDKCVEAQDFIDPVADLIGVLALWANVAMDHIQQAVIWAEPKAEWAMDKLTEIPASSLAAAWLTALGSEAVIKLQKALVHLLFRFQIRGVYVGTAVVSGLSATLFVRSISRCAEKYYLTKFNDLYV